MRSTLASSRADRGRFEWLGHAGPAFTMRTYVHNQDDALKIAAATLQRVDNVVKPRGRAERPCIRRPVHSCTPMHVSY